MNSENGRTDAERRLAERLHAWAEIGERAGRRYASLSELVLDLGEWHRPTPFPRELRRRRGRYAACYANAAHRAASVAGLRYVEGFADSGLEPDGHAFEHAWCVTAYGTVLDPTWTDDPWPRPPTWACRSDWTIGTRSGVSVLASSAAFSESWTCGPTQRS